MDGARKDEVSYPRLRKTNTAVLSPRCSLTSRFYKRSREEALREKEGDFTCDMKIKEGRIKSSGRIGGSHWNLHMLIAGGQKQSFYNILVYLAW